MAVTEELRRVGGTMKRRRGEAGEDAERDHDGDRRMEDAEEDAAMCTHDREELTDDEAPLQKKAMLIKTNLRFLEKIPPLHDYQRAQNGRRGAIDGGTLTGAMMMAALEESFEETSFVTLEPPSRAAMVAPTPMPMYAVPQRNPVTRSSPTRVTVSERSTLDGAAVQQAVHAAKDDEARPASQ